MNFIMSCSPRQPYQEAYVLLQADAVLMDGDNKKLNKTLKESMPTVHSHNTYLDVHIKSGEYFSTLATTLDGISDHPELQQIVRDLMYLQQYYRIVKK